MLDRILDTLILTLSGLFFCVVIAMWIVYT